MESILQKERSLTDLERETFFRRLGLLLQGGLPILRALGALEGHSGPAVKKLCRSLARSLGRGFSLSQALRQQERQAGNLAAPLAAAGEASGQLPLVFRHLANFYQKKRENQKTVLQACLYPALVLTLALVLGGVFCWLALPLLGDLYGTLGLVPPAGFRLLLALLSEAARLLDQDFQARLKQLRTLLEPVLLLVLALGCAGMLAGLLSPLFALLQGLPLLP